MKSLQAIFIGFLILDLLGIGGLWYGSDMMQKEKALESTLRLDLLTEELDGKKMQDQKLALSASADDRRALSQFIFQATDEDQIRYITAIEHLGTSTSGAFIEATSLDSSKPGVFTGEFKIVGTWSQVYHTIRLIEEFPARIVISKIDLKESGEGTWTGVVKADLVSVKAVKK